MNTIRYERNLTAEEYNELRGAAGFNRLTPGQAQRGLAHTTFALCAREGERAVGMGRVLFDYGYTAYIGDVFIRPAYQRQGIGTQIVGRLMKDVLDSAEVGDRIMFILGAAKGKEAFYEKLGFKRRPNEGAGCGMSLSVVKEEESALTKNAFRP